LAFSISINHDAWSFECQTSINSRLGHYFTDGPAEMGLVGR